MYHYTKIFYYYVWCFLFCFSFYFSRTSFECWHSKLPWNNWLAKWNFLNITVNLLANPAPTIQWVFRKNDSIDSIIKSYSSSNGFEFTSNIFIQEINKTQLGSYIVIATNIGRFSWNFSVNQKGKYICISIYFFPTYSVHSKMQNNIPRNSDWLLPYYHNTIVYYLPLHYYLYIRGKLRISDWCWTPLCTSKHK